jgi:hypothetical protein
MRRGLIDHLIDLFRSASGKGSGSADTPAPRGRARKPKPSPTPKPSPAPKAAPSRDIDADSDELVFEYSPELDGDPDPGEVVWTWVPYEEDPTQGKDRPVVIVGRRRRTMVGVALTSKRRDDDSQVPVGTGAWDREGRPSYAKIDRLLEIDPEQVRREGAVLPQRTFDELVVAVRREHSR